MVGNKYMGEDPKSEAYIGAYQGAYQDIMDSFAKATKPLKLSGKGEEAYLKIQGLQDACYEIARMTGNTYGRKTPGETKDTISSRKKEITEYVAALPKKDRDLITEKLKEDPKAYYSAGAVMSGIAKEEGINPISNVFFAEVEKRIGDREELARRVEISIDYDEGRIVGPAGPGSETYETAKEAWEKVKDSNLNWQKLPEEEKQIWEEYFGGEKEEGVRKDVERKANEESK